MKVDFSDYALGARVATDLVNTAAVVRRSTGESLADPPALARFLAERGIVPDALADGAPSDDDLDAVHILRDEVRDVIGAGTEDRAVDAANAMVARAGTGPALHRDVDDRWRWYIATSARAPLADELAVLMGAGLLGVLHTLSHDRFRHCASPVCEGMFVDTSRAGRRRYCMPDLCGNRLNVANHRARQRASTERTSAGRRP